MAVSGFPFEHLGDEQFFAVVAFLIEACRFVVHRCSHTETFNAEVVWDRFDDQRIVRLFDPFPEHFIIVGIFVLDIPVQSTFDTDRGLFRGCDFHFDSAKFLDVDAQEAGEMDGDFFTVLHYRKEAFQAAFFHIQRQVEVFHFIGVKIDFFSVHKDVHIQKIHRIDHFSEIFRVAVFPPADACFVGIPDARQIRALMVIARIGFLEVSAHAHVAVAETGQTFLQATIFFV